MIQIWPCDWYMCSFYLVCFPSLSLNLLTRFFILFLYSSAIIITKTRERQRCWREGERRAIERAYCCMHSLYRRVLSLSAATWRPSHILNPINIIIYLIQTNWLKKKSRRNDKKNIKVKCNFISKNGASSLRIFLVAYGR